MGIFKSKHGSELQHIFLSRMGIGSLYWQVLFRYASAVSPFVTTKEVKTKTTIKKLRAAPQYTRSVALFGTNNQTNQITRKSIHKNTYSIIFHRGHALHDPNETIRLSSCSS
jgi:hypothetical protein